MMVWELDIVIKQPEKTYCNKFNYQGQMTKKVPETWKKQQTRSAPARGGLEGGKATSDSQTCVLYSYVLDLYFT